MCKTFEKWFGNVSKTIVAFVCMCAGFDMDPKPIAKGWFTENW